jgi:hypothetical protein
MGLVLVYERYEVQLSGKDVYAELGHSYFFRHYPEKFVSKPRTKNSHI